MREQGHSLTGTLSALLVTALVGWSTPTHASGAREVVVVDLSADTRENAQIRHEVIRAVRRTDGYDIRNVDSILNAGAEADEQANIRTAMAFKEAGIEALNRGDASGHLPDHLAGSR